MEQGRCGRIYSAHNVLESMRRNGVIRLVFTSTSAVYGLNDGQLLTETMPTRPISLYGASKLACEAMIGAYQHLFDMRSCIFRLANIVGTKTRRVGATVISDFIRKLSENPCNLHFGNGKQTKSYLLASECVAAMLFVVDNADEPLALYNIGCGDSLSVTDIADIVTREMGLRDVEYSCTQSWMLAWTCRGSFSTRQS